MYVRSFSRPPHPISTTNHRTNDHAHARAPPPLFSHRGSLEEIKVKSIQISSGEQAQKWRVAKVTPRTSLSASLPPALFSFCFSICYGSSPNPSWPPLAPTVLIFTPADAARCTASTTSSLATDTLCLSQPHPPLSLSHSLARALFLYRCRARLK